MTTAVASETGVQNRRSLLVAELVLLGVALIWGINIPVIKTGLEQMDWYSLNAVRLTVSAIILGVLGWLERRRGIIPASNLGWTPILIFAVFISLLYQIFFLVGVSRTASGTTSLILATIPMWTALIARAFLKDKLHLLAWTGLVVAFVGTVIVGLDKPSGSAAAISSGSRLAGTLAILGAAVSWAAGTVCSRPLMKSISPIQLSAWAAAISLPVHLALAAPTFSESVTALRQPSVWAVVLYSGIFSTGLALPMWNFGVRRAGAAQAAIFQNLVPVIAIASAWLMRSETISVGQILGGVLIIGGLITMRTTRPNP